VSNRPEEEHFRKLAIAIGLFTMLVGLAASVMTGYLCYMDVYYVEDKGKSDAWGFLCFVAIASWLVTTALTVSICLHASPWDNQ
jgi:hypothetical protein